jgi:hypothetical protein
MSSDFKQTLVVDFDGVIHSYTSGWESPTIIRDPPVPGAIKFLRDATKYFKVAIYSSRSGQDGGIRAMQDYIADHALKFDKYAESWFSLLSWPVTKPSGFLTIDDRAYLFTGTFPDPKEFLTFKPWNKK